ncbi:hypothetical protein [Holdemania massiliensis]|uniref:Uncharacterized protein n=1 Tax=Holdemania massiliensis TaxID=1468449 RepID=A0A6N7SA24_9FIRM|nr:hypothetical protein [Holdemania massiliensis]MSA72478.1 hypothetical protein [Holdemania massiliensis]MSA90754.1 hypothetical protein [Holdemania massiliensis]MSB79593.1 hypothetical protein [Holdemania massiliensis]MSC34484.1 hypothetical protein [Holdemania massiliensis]MSC40874.1 hypothetical protein [Holdemania massiliensis]
MIVYDKNDGGIRKCFVRIQKTAKAALIPLPFYGILLDGATSLHIAAMEQAQIS